MFWMWLKSNWKRKAQSISTRYGLRPGTTWTNGPCCSLSCKSLLLTSFFWSSSFYRYFLAPSLIFPNSSAGTIITLSLESLRVTRHTTLTVVPCLSWCRHGTQTCCSQYHQCSRSRDSQDSLWEPHSRSNLHHDNLDLEHMVQCFLRHILLYLTNHRSLAKVFGANLCVLDDDKTDKTAKKLSKADKLEEDPSNLGGRPLTPAAADWLQTSPV